MAEKPKNQIERDEEYLAELQTAVEAAAARLHESELEIAKKFAHVFASQGDLNKLFPKIQEASDGDVRLLATHAPSDEMEEYILALGRCVHEAGGVSRKAGLLGHNEFTAIYNVIQKSAYTELTVRSKRKHK